MTAPVQLDPADLDELVEILKAGGFTSVQFEPGKVEVPGVWIKINTIEPTTLASGVTKTLMTLHLVVRDQEFREALGELLPMFDQLCDVLTPSGPAVPNAVALPASSTPLPALAVPFELHTTFIPEESP